MGLTTVYTPSGGTVTGALRIVAKASTSLPVEVCERIIEQLATEPDVEDIPTRKALLACALVSKAFYTMSRAVFCRHIAIMRWDLLQGFVKLLKGKPALLGLVESVYLSGRATRDDLRPPRASGALATFPLIFAQKLPRLHKLHICCMNPLWFYHLQSYFYDALRRFTSVTVLYLRDVTFTSANHFARLLDSLPHLEWFTCADLRWIHHGQPILQLPRRTDIKLNRLSLQTSLMSPENTRTLLEFFASSDRAAGIQRLKIGRLELSNIEHLRVGQLLHAAGSSLRHLQLSAGVVVDSEENTDSVTATSISLSANNNLQSLTLKIHAFYKDLYHCGWLAPLLSQSSSDQLREVNIHMKIGASTDVVSAFLAGISSKQCSAIDDTLTHPRMSRLKYVAWHVFDYTDHPTSEASIRELFAVLFPKLHTQGLLLCNLYPVPRR